MFFFFIKINFSYFQLKLKDQSVIDVFEGITHTFNECDIFKTHGVDIYLASLALAVKSSYRGRGIATEILRARRPLMEEMRISVSSTCFSIIGSQKAAQNAGFIEDYVIS